MQLTFASGLAIFALAGTAAAKNAFQGCWMVSTTTHGQMMCSDVVDPTPSLCYGTETVRTQTVAMFGLPLDDTFTQAVVYKPYTCYFFTNANCAGNVGGNRLGADYVQVLGGALITNFYPGMQFHSYRCDRTDSPQ